MNHIITIDEYLMGRITFDELTSFQKADVEDLLDKVNRLRLDFERSTGRVAGKNSSGYRSLAKHIAIYNAKGITDLKLIPMGSQHLHCQAIDVFDGDDMFDKWLDINPEKLIEYDLYREASVHTKGWVHLQLLPPRSKRRTFNI